MSGRNKVHIACQCVCACVTRQSHSIQELLFWCYNYSSHKITVMITRGILSVWKSFQLCSELTKGCVLKATCGQIFEECHQWQNLTRQLNHCSRLFVTSMSRLLAVRDTSWTTYYLDLQHIPFISLLAWQTKQKWDFWLAKWINSVILPPGEMRCTAFQCTYYVIMIKMCHDEYSL